jgi:hypothetical protein
VENPIIPNNDTVQVGDGFLDIQRPHALWTQVNNGPAELCTIGDWFDRSRSGFPTRTR